MRRNVWILNHYAGGMPASQGGRHYWFAKFLKRRGYDPVVFCGNAKHGQAGSFCEGDDLWQEKPVEQIDVPFVYVKTREYSGNGRSRVQNMLDYYRNVQKAAVEYAAAHGAPDVVIGSSVHPLACQAAIKLAKRFKCKSVVEIRDLWPLSLEDYGMIPRGGVVAKALYVFEHRLYRQGDAVIFTMPGGPQYIRDKKWDTDGGGDVDMRKVHYINNGIDLEVFDQNAESNPFTCPELEPHGVPKVVYAGSVRRVNHLGYLVDVATAMREDPVEFVVIGDGNELPALREVAAERSLQNISFIGRIEKRLVPAALQHATVCTALCDPTAQAGVARYGTSNNKVFEYLASGKPIITNTVSEYSFINQYGCGREDVFDTPEKYAAFLREMLADPEALARYGANARATAEQFSFDKLTDRLIEIIESIA